MALSIAVKSSQKSVHLIGGDNPVLIAVKASQEGDNLCVIRDKADIVQKISQILEMEAFIFLNVNQLDYGLAV